MKLGKHLEKEWLIDRETTGGGAEDQGQEETVLEESSLVALGRRKSPLQRWHRQQELGHSCPVPITVRSEVTSLGRKEGRSRSAQEGS